MPLYEGIGLINEKHPVVLEIGQAFTKAGFAGENAPRCFIPSTVPSKDNPSKVRKLIDYQDESDLYQMLVDFLNTIYFKHLLVTPKDRKVVIVESLFCKSQWRHTLAKVLYLHYEILTVLWIPSHLAAVCSTGADTALVVDVGYSEALVLPVVNGVTLLNHVQAQDLGSKTFDENLKTLLLDNCTNKPKEELEPLLTPEVIEDIRLRACFVTKIRRAQFLSDPSFSSNLNPQLKPFKYEIDGDNFVEFEGILREQAAEVWFHNKDPEGSSLPYMILDCLASCPIDTRRKLASSILITGGTPMLPGFKARLVRELKKIESELGETKPDFKDEKFTEKFRNGTYEFRIFSCPIKENCVNWLGGAVYGASEAVNLRGVTKEFFMKNEIVPDWCNPGCNSVTGIVGVSNAASSPFGSGVGLPKGL
ncbi:Actin-related protein 10 [Orchesella cincta]|uniref:Actin-related protein 10 n=1 Tax=Orchesella cincta TaxID=48709 RepID=A0A1D2NH50_ORCCI|nr:Actin-related protein 10 [Orchesella cincta]